MYNPISQPFFKNIASNTFGFCKKIRRGQSADCYFRCISNNEIEKQIIEALFLLCAGCKDFFSAQQIFLLFVFPQKSFVAVEPFDIFQSGVFVKLVEETIVETSGSEK